EWTCPECHTFHDRDVNACLNLLQFAEFKIGQEVSESTPNQTVETLCIKSASS
ncbi:RNA-guided endonuclease InsQ/TnpB family protein, partial [Limnoraphis robusta]